MAEPFSIHFYSSLFYLFRFGPGQNTEKFSLGAIALENTYFYACKQTNFSLPVQKEGTIHPGRYTIMLWT